jgi:hypothetical protein
VAWSDVEVTATNVSVADLTDTATNNHFLVGNGTNFVQATGATARAAMGVAIGSDVQAYDDDLQVFSTNVPAAIIPHDGAGSGIDSDFLDGFDSAVFVQRTESFDVLADISTNGVQLGYILEWDGSDFVPVANTNAGTNVTASLQAQISSNDTDIAALQGYTNKADVAYSWGDHSTNGYLTAETDSVFTNWLDTNALYATVANLNLTNDALSARITANAGFTNAADTAYGWGDHSTNGYLTSETDGVFTNWLDTNTYVKVEIDPIFTNWLDTNTVVGAEVDPVFTNWLDTNAYVQTEVDPVFTNWLDTNAVLGASAGLWESNAAGIYLVDNPVMVGETNTDNAVITLQTPTQKVDAFYIGTDLITGIDTSAVLSEASWTNWLDTNTLASISQLNGTNTALSTRITANAEWTNKADQAYSWGAHPTIGTNSQDFTWGTPYDMQVLDDDWPWFSIEDEAFPKGVGLTKLYLKLPVNNITYTITLQKWSSPSDGSPDTIQSITLTNAYEGNVPITNYYVGTNEIIYVDLPTNIVNWVHGTLIYTNGL